MGIWAEIKYALNSTVGTDLFRPLDKIINGTKVLQPSDENLYDLYTLSNDEMTSAVPQKHINSFRTYLSGTVKLILKGQYRKRTSDNTSPNGTISAIIYRNNVQIGKVELFSFTFGTI